MTIPSSEWKFYGYPGHFIGSQDCLFHLCTKVGDLVVSTVGDYRPGHSRQRPVEVGLNRLFETMVFPFVKEDEWGVAIIDPSNPTDHFNAYNDPKEALDGHHAMCALVAAEQVPA